MVAFMCESLTHKGDIGVYATLEDTCSISVQMGQYSESWDYCAVKSTQRVASAVAFKR